MAQTGLNAFLQDKVSGHLRASRSWGHGSPRERRAVSSAILASLGAQHAKNPRPLGLGRLSNNSLTARIEAALAAERANAKPGTPWTEDRRILENLAEMGQGASAALVNPENGQYGDACAFPESDLPQVQRTLGLGDENPFMTAEEWLGQYEEEQA